MSARMWEHSRSQTFLIVFWSVGSTYITNLERSLPFDAVIPPSRHLFYRMKEKLQAKLYIE